MNTRLKRTMLGLAAALFVASSAGALEVDGLAATVGTVSILRSEVLGEMQHAGLDESQFAACCSRLIDRKLILLAAKDAKMQMQDWIVENRVNEIIRDVFGGDRNKLISALANEKLPYSEWRNRIRDDLVIGAMRWNMVDKNVLATPRAMREEFAAHPERYRSVARVSVSVILLRPEDAAKKDEVAAALKTQAFADVARTYSADGHASEGGLWKDVKPEDQFRPEICAAINKLAKGEMSSWVELEGWNFLLRKEDETAATARTFAEAYDDIEANVKAAESKRLYDEWMERLKATTFVKVY